MTTDVILLLGLSEMACFGVRKWAGSMRVLITGAAGMIGRKLTAALLARGTVQGKAISQLVLHDIVQAEVAAPHTALVGDLSVAGVAEALVRRG